MLFHRRIQQKISGLFLEAKSSLSLQHSVEEETKKTEEDIAKAKAKVEEASSSKKQAAAESKD